MCGPPPFCSCSEHSWPAAEAAAPRATWIHRSTSPARPTLPLLAVTNVPGIEHNEQALTRSAVASEGPKGVDLDGLLGSWRFVTGAQRQFRGGPPRTFVDIVSRTFQFGSPAGARAFVRFVRDNPGTYLGPLRATLPVAGGGRDGFLLTARGCGCHEENPLFLYVASSGERVTWLMTNGPQVTATSDPPPRCAGSVGPAG